MFGKKPNNETFKTPDQAVESLKLENAKQSIAACLARFDNSDKSKVHELASKHEA